MKIKFIGLLIVVYATVTAAVAVASVGKGGKFDCDAFTTKYTSTGLYEKVGETNLSLRLGEAQQFFLGGKTFVAHVAPAVEGKFWLELTRQNNGQPGQISQALFEADKDAMVSSGVLDGASSKAIFEFVTLSCVQI
jgi:hypothetical protein